MMYEVKKIGLCGSPEFVVPFFQKILESREYKVEFVITQAAKLANRMKLEDTAVAKWAKKNELECFEIDKIKGVDHSHLESRLGQVDCILIFAFGKIIPQSWLDLVKMGWLNIHPSKLPLLRGPTPIHGAILNNFKSSALSLMKINARMDEGNLIAQKDFEIGDDDTTNSLMEKLQTWGPSWVLEKIDAYLSGELKDFPQEGPATYCHLIQKKDYFIESETSVHEILLKIRALGWVFLEIYNMQVKCFSAKFADENSVLNIHGIEPILVQKPGGKILGVKDFLNGVKILQ